jgi:hypothetical protein
MGSQGARHNQQLERVISDISPGRFRLTTDGHIQLAFCKLHGHSLHLCRSTVSRSIKVGGHDTEELTGRPHPTPGHRLVFSFIHPNVKASFLTLLRFRCSSHCWHVWPSCHGTCNRCNCRIFPYQSTLPDGESTVSIRKPSTSQSSCYLAQI